MSLMLPQGQKLLTNVSVVRIKKGKEKFEIATYPNTVVTWRTGAEKDVREVLQIDRVFRSVEQGEYAKSKDLQKCFGSDDQAAICLEILKAGEIQLTEKERGSQQESLLKEICTMVAERCVNSQSKRPVTVGVVERALAELHFNVDRNKNAKKQALEAIKLLEGKYPIERLPMNLKITFPQAAKAEAREKMAALGAIFDREDDSGGMYVMVCKVAPDKFRDIDAAVRAYQVFATREELAAHMKTDWHKHNLALKSAGKPMLTKEEFLDFKIMSQDGVAVRGGGGGEGERNASKPAGGKKGKGKKDIDLWD